jgi:two-component system, OmpR family, sensor histidine kinase KdpD
VTAIVTAGHALRGQSLSEDDRSELLGAVVEEGERLSALIDKLLDLSRLQAGRAVSSPDWLTLEEVLLAARDALPIPPADVHVSADEGVPDIRGDAAQLHQAFANLLENAWRYSDGRPVSVRIRAAGSHVIVRVVDQGPGIPPAEQERIFEPFYRGAPAGQSKWKGSGLGLAIAKGFVEANGGTISVDSLPGQGTSFVVELPVVDRQRTPVA